MKNRLSRITSVALLALLGVFVGSVAGTASVAAPPAVVDVVSEVETADAAGLGCTQGTLSVTDYYMEDGVMYPNTAKFECYTTYNPGLWIRIKVTCSFGATLYSAWIKTIGIVTVSCGPGWGHLTSWELKTKWV